MKIWGKLADRGKKITHLEEQMVLLRSANEDIWIYAWNLRKLYQEV